MKLREYGEKELKNVEVVLMRADFNVPMKNRKVVDDSRIRAVVHEIEKISKQGIKVVLMSHLGRPQGKRVSDLSLRPVAHQLAKLLANKVQFSDEITGPGVKSKIDRMKPGEVMLLENLRFDSGEVLNSTKFAKDLARLGDIFINNAFGVSHRAHSSVAGITKYIPSYAGDLLREEVFELSKDLIPPSILILGGVKLETKVGLIESLA